MIDKMVSVIIPFYRNVKWLAEAVDSVLNQTFRDFEIIIVNDGSPEDMSYFLEKYEQHVVYKYKENGGPASARNLGIDIAKGKYIAFLDSDDLWINTKLEKQVVLMESNDADWSHTNWAQFEDNNPENVVRKYVDGNNGFIYPGSLVSLNIATPSVIVKTEVLKSSNEYRFSEKMRFGQDYYLWLQLSYKYPIFLINEVLCKVRLRSGENAVKRARVHLQLRAQIFELLCANKSKVFIDKRCGIMVKLTYRLCFIMNNLLKGIENRLKISKIKSENFAKIFYLIPYAAFKILKRIKY